MRKLVLLPAVLLILLFAACGGGDDDDATAAVTTATPVATATAAGTPAPTATTRTRLPTILYMRHDNTGTSAVNVIFGTDVDTSVVYNVIGAAGSGLGSQVPPAGTRQSEHIASIATAGEPVRVEVTATDARGNVVTGAIEVGGVVGKQYWGRGDSGPKLEMLPGLKGKATWTNQKAASAPLSVGSVMLFASKTGCSPFRPCAVTYIGAGGLEKSGASADGTIEAHQVDFDFPQADRDYMVVLAARPSATAWEFYQFVIASTQLKP
ncbi:MAG: hypothetical protein U0547_01640 [Dehalococcoidia bacterium]